MIRGYVDNATQRSIEGRFPSDKSARDADGIAKSDVDDVIHAMQDAGFRLRSDDVNAMLTQYLRYGLLTGVTVTARMPDGSTVVVPLAIDAANPPVPNEACVDGYRLLERGPGMWLVSPSGDSKFASVHLAIALPTVTHCSCGRAACERLSAVRKHLATTVPTSGRPCAFERKAKGERLNRALRLAGTFGIFAPLPQHVRKGRPDIPLAARAFALVLEQMLGDEYDDAASLNVRAPTSSGLQDPASAPQHAAAIRQGRLRAPAARENARRSSASAD